MWKVEGWKSVEAIESFGGVINPGPESAKWSGSAGREKKKKGEDRTEGKDLQLWTNFNSTSLGK